MMEGEPKPLFLPKTRRKRKSFEPLLALLSHNRIPQGVWQRDVFTAFMGRSTFCFASLRSARVPRPAFESEYIWE